MTESGSTYIQIAKGMRLRIAALNMTYATELPHKKQAISYAPEVIDLIKKNPEMIPITMKHYDDLVDSFNSLVQEDSPLLALFPHSQQLKRKLVYDAGRLNLPSLEEMQHWVPAGIKDAASRIEIGNCLDPKNTETENPFNEQLKKNNIISPVRSDLDPETRLVAIEGHVVERIYFVWLSKQGYVGRKDEILSVLDEMIKYRHLIGKPSPLEIPHTKLGWVKQDKLEKLRQQYELESGDLPGAVIGHIPEKDHENTVFKKGASLNYYEDPNPLLNHLLARKVGAISEKISKQIGTDPKKAFSAVLNTGEGITTVSFGEWEEEGNEMKRDCEIRTRGKNVVGNIEHVTLFAIQNPDGSYSYSMDKEDKDNFFEMDYKHISLQVVQEWMRSFTDEKYEDEFTHRPTIPFMLNQILSQVKGESVDYFAIKYPDQSPRAIAKKVLGPDIIIDEEKNMILVPTKKRRENLSWDEVVFKKTSLSDFLKKERNKCDPTDNFRVCDEAFEAIYGYAAQSVTTSEL